ncbi:HAMP domain-containing histidine kinase [Candidatus Dependentiae bacterium]|nr:HAMP domain-containing histidine kinase [Candidatus Dependentiae bacterium]
MVESTNKTNVDKSIEQLISLYPVPICLIEKKQSNKYSIICCNSRFDELLKNLNCRNFNEFFKQSKKSFESFFYLLELRNKIENFLIKLRKRKETLYLNLTSVILSEKPLRIFINFEDITERVIVQKKMNIMADVFNFFSNGVMIFAKKNNGLQLIENNQSFEHITGYQFRDIKDTFLYKLPIWFNKKDFRGIVKTLESDPEKNYIKDVVIKIRHKTGRIIKAGLIINSFKDINNKIIRLNIMLSDITDRLNFQNQIKLKTRQLEEDNKIIRNMTHTITHKFSNYLSPIITYANLWIDRIKGNKINNEDLLKSFETIKRILEELNVFIDNSIKLSRYEAEIIDAQPIIIRQLFDNVVLFYKDLMVKKNIKLKIGIPDKIKVFGNGFLINEVIDNLINNAVKYSPDNSEINCNYKMLKNGFVWFSVESESAPIPVQYRKMIFRPYYRLSSLFDQPGDGLGLAICNNIIKHHNGKIGVISEKKNGNIFYFTLPLKPEYIKGKNK